MNEQLIVKNFGPIKEATVDFKRVTVFIGPTGGGKSTLAKLAAVFRDVKELGHPESNVKIFTLYGLANFNNKETEISWQIGKFMMSIREWVLAFNDSLSERLVGMSTKFVTDSSRALKFNYDPSMDENVQSFAVELRNHLLKEIVQKASTLAMDSLLKKSIAYYLPSERGFLASLEYSWAGLMRDDIGLPKILLDFANSFSLSRKDVEELEIPFLNAKYLHVEGRDFIKIPEREEPLMLLETASGIQSVTPLLVLLEHLSRNTEQAQSFIIEEPELNLYPTAQQGLLNWLVEKCTQGDNDLTITTHSPYILSHLNLLLYAHQVAHNYPDRAEAVAELVPRASWINPQEFACYQVENGGVTSLVNAELGLIDDNGLDNLSGDAADAFDNLIRLSKSVVLK